jgi:hypothetical protein
MQAAPSPRPSVGPCSASGPLCGRQRPPAQPCEAAPGADVLRSSRGPPCSYPCMRGRRRAACGRQRGRQRGARPQVSAGRPIPVLAQHTFPGNVILSARATSGLAPPSLPDAELERLCLAHLAGAPPPRGRSPLARARGACRGARCAMSSAQAPPECCGTARRNWVQSHSQPAVGTPAVFRSHRQTCSACEEHSPGCT